MDYPAVRREEFVTELHGVKVYDAYRWLEDPDSPETRTFVDAQNEISVPYLKKCESRDYINEKLTQMWNYPKYSCPYKRGSRYFFFMNSGLQNQSVMYVQDDLQSEPRVFLDPNQLSEDGTIAISGSAFSEDGEIFAYGLSSSGSDWVSIHFKKVANGENYPEILEKVRFSSIAWTHDGKGIFYAAFLTQEGKTDGSETTLAENQKLYYHHLNTPQSEDILVVEFPEQPKWRICSEVTDCGSYLVVTISKDCRDNLLYYSELPKQITGKLNLTCIVDKFEADYEYVTNSGAVCVFRTNKDAPNYHLVKIDLNSPSQDNWTTLILEHEKNVLDWAACVDNNKLIVCYICDVKSILQVHSLESGEFLHMLPLDIGTVSGYTGKRKHKEMFYQFTSFLSPATIYHIDFSQHPIQPKVLRDTKIKNFDASQCVMKQVFYASKDGTKIPMFIVHRKDLVLRGSAPTLLYGYGGFNYSLMPQFSISRIVFMQLFDGVVAVPNLRGGGEYGEKWHNAGRLKNKQNVFDDFIAAAEYLIQEGYTSSNKLTIHGHSNGGLLVGACINQRPNLFGAAVAGVGVMDLLRFHKFTIGHAWCSDYGNPDEKEDFENVMKLSPLHNVKPPQEGVQYPCTLLMTADHDDRVVPLHSYKLIAELQYTIGSLLWQKNPLLIRIDTKAGHGGGKPTAKLIEEITDIYWFISMALGIPVSH